MFVWVFGYEFGFACVSESYQREDEETERLLTTDRNPKGREVILGLPHLVSYMERIHDEYFPDYEKWESSKAWSTGPTYEVGRTWDVSVQNRE